MPTNQQQTAKIIMGSLFALVAILGILSFVAPPSLFPDPANGFLVMRSMEMGGKFNMMVAPDQDDFSKSTSEFLTWWSPGQYLVPYAFKLLFGVNSGQASALTVLLCQLLGVWGFYVFFKKVGFTPLVSVISLLFIACQQFFVVPYVFYNGGEILSFAFTGWFLYGCVSFKNISWQMVLFILFSGLIGFFCKSSMMWVFAAGLLFIWIRLSSPNKDIITWIKNGAWIAIPAIIVVATIYLSFLSKGQNPTSASPGLKLTLKTFAFPLASPLLSGFSIDDICHGLIYHTGKIIFNDWQAIIILILIAILSLWLVRNILKKVSDQNYRLLLIIFYSVAFVFFGYVYLMQKTISYEARHFRVIGLLVIPGAIYLLSQVKKPYRHLLCFVWAGIAFTSIFYLVKGYRYNKNKSAHGVSGIAQQNIDQAALNKVMAIDNQVRNATFVFVNKELGLEIKHNRILGFEPIGNDLKIDFDDYEHDGHAGLLYIILPDNYAGPKEKFILKSFPDYKGWYGSKLSDKYVMYEAK
ncbi:MAG: hypothetical protein JST50_00550 [Bacteroidetes bacterium]|jgi:hypothetical protein|nr:hypothetical protein [Bacteroidota bacterium]